MSTANSSAARPPRRRFLALACLGLAAILGALGLRYSPWQHERFLRSLNLEELALVIHDRPNDSRAFTYFGRALAADGALPNAAAVLEHAVKLNPRNVDAQLSLGDLLARQNDLLGAVAAFEAALKVEPNNVDANMAAAQAYQLTGRPSRAITALTKVTKLQPRNAVAWHQLGRMYGDSNQADKATDCIQKALAIDDTKAVYWRDLGHLARHYGKYNEARDHLLKAIKLDPEDPIAYFWLGQVYTQLGNTPFLRNHAEHYFASALNRDPTLARCHLELGLLYERSGNTRMAVARYRQAIEVDPNDQRSLYNLGQLLLRLGKREEGRRMVEQAHRLTVMEKEIQSLRNRVVAMPEDRDLRLRLARVLAKYGQVERAMTQYLAYQQMGAKDQAVQREMDELRSTAMAKAMQRTVEPGAQP